MTKSASLVVVLSNTDKEIEGILCPVRGSVQAEQKEAEEKAKAVNLRAGRLCLMARWRKI